MIEFVESGEMWINVYRDKRYISQLIKYDGVWGLQYINSRIGDADYLRQIADKLDELNGVELPEFLKEQA